MDENNIQENGFQENDLQENNVQETTAQESTVQESTAMTDEEIRAAAENIGSTPYSSYVYTNNASNEAYGAGCENVYTADTNATPNINTKEPKKKGGAAKVAKLLAGAACFGLIAGACFFGTEKALSLFFESDDTKESSVASSSSSGNVTTVSSTGSGNGVTSLVIAGTDVTEEGRSDDSVVVNVVKENMSSAVAISATYVTTSRYFGQVYSYESEGGGSGFIVGTNDTELLVATNNHVVENTSALQVVFCDDTKVAATVRATDPDNDLAIVSVPLSDIPKSTMDSITVATLGNSDTSEIGEMVIAIGNALGYGQSVTVGYLSAKDRSVTVDNKTLSLLQTDAAINEGNSGGPLFNTSGEVIGINCAKYSDTSVEGMCFAIPISAAIPILQDLMTQEILTEEDQGYLGVSIKTISDEVASFYGWPTGVYVYSVNEGSAAEKAGIFTGDIIVAVNGRKTLTTEALKNAVNSYKYGTTVSVSILRYSEQGKYEEMTIDVTLMKKPE
ncbi:MAG: trypsin-like peptidase domain-containing protein [Lachnospiraceae bacterium]|nr:trypsin-like peptidase domain-containing protein [Lachnospiraceae bacterium]